METLGVIWFKRAIFFILPVLVPSLIVHGADWMQHTQAKPIKEDTAQLTVGHTDIIRSFEDKQVLCEMYLVKKGDCIWEILRERVNGSVSQILHWSKVLQTLNPRIVDLTNQCIK